MTREFSFNLTGWKAALFCAAGIFGCVVVVANLIAKVWTTLS